MRLLIVHNPSAGSGTPSDQIASRCERHGHDVTMVDIDGNWSAEVERSAADLVVVAGGDGTVSTVLTAMANTRWRVAVLPLGTANNIARALDLSIEDPWDEIAAWGQERRRVIDFDVASVDHDVGLVPFVESFGGGFVAAALSSADGETTTVDGNEHGRRHLLEVLDTIEPAPWDLEIDGRVRSGEYLAVEIMNVATVGPVLSLAPSARPDDGRLDVVLVAEDDRDPLRDAIRRGAEPVCSISSLRATSVRTKVAGGVWIHLDDRSFRSDGRPSQVTVGRRSVRTLRG